MTEVPPGRGPGSAPRDAAGKWIKTVESAERDAEAARMFSRGHTYPQIAETLGYGDRHHARRAVLDALAAVPAEAVSELRKSQLALLAELKLMALEVAQTPHLLVSRTGKIVKDDEGKELLDDGPKLAAIDRLERLVAREAALTGTPMPARHRLESGEDTEREAELEDLIAQAKLRLAGPREPGAQGGPGGA